jgi:transposase
LAKLLQANQRLNIAYVLKESFGQLWTCQSEAWARPFFENWKQALKWQRLKPCQKFARMIDRHWEGIAAYCQPQNKVPLGFVEGLNNKIRILQCRAYGLRNEEYLRLKVLTSDFVISAENDLAHLGCLSGQFVDQSRTGFRVAESGLG